MSAILTEPDVGTKRLLSVLAADAQLMNLSVTVVIGGSAVVRKVQGVHYLVAPQGKENPYPCIVVNPPIAEAPAQRMYGNGPHIMQAGFLQDVRVAARDVEPNDPGLLAMRARVQELRAAIAGAVTGGNANTCIVAGWTPDQRIDEGAYVYAEIGVTFRIFSSIN